MVNWGYHLWHILPLDYMSSDIELEMCTELRIKCAKVKIWLERERERAPLERYASSSHEFSRDTPTSRCVLEIEAT